MGSNLVLFGISCDGKGVLCIVFWFSEKQTALFENVATRQVHQTPVRRRLPACGREDRALPAREVQACPPRGQRTELPHPLSGMAPLTPTNNKNRDSHSISTIVHKNKSQSIHLGMISLLPMQCQQHRCFRKGCFCVPSSPADAAT